MQAEAYAILKRFDALCRKHGLRYTLSGGTCLRAVRHQGFIPWDDDVDLPLPEFIKFLECARVSGTPEGIELLVGMARGGADFIPKWCNTHTLAIIPSRSRRSFSQWLDVLPIFALSDDEAEAREQLRIVRDNALGLLLFALFRTDHLYMNPKVMMSPSTCFFYAVGICLTRFKVEDGYRIFNDKFTPVVLLALVASVIAGVRQTIFHGHAVPISLLGMLMGAMMIAHGGVMIEQHLSKLSKKMAPLGQATFVVFMIHWPIFYGVAHLFPAIKSSLWVLLLPLPTYAVIVTVFLTMKRYTPWLMPYLGHMKIRTKTQHS